MAKKSIANINPELINAARSGDVVKIRKLMAEGADVDYSPPAGTPLANAVTAGKIEAAAELIKAGADINQHSLFGTLVEEAVSRKQPRMVAFLLKSGAKPGANGGDCTPLLKATTANDLAMVKLLLEHGADINETGSVTCGEFGSPEVKEEKSGNVVFRTTHIPNPPVAQDATPLMVATRRGYEKLVKFLLEKGADPALKDREGFTALAWARKLGKDAIARLLQEHGAPALEFEEGSAEAALLAAATKGDVGRLKQLLAKGVDVNLKRGTDEDAERTALMSAAEHGRVETAQFLIQSGADVNAACGHGWLETNNKTALMYAAQNGHAGIIRLLLEHKAKVNAKDREANGGGRAALHYAAENGHAEALTVLLDAGAPVDFRTAEGTTALALACGGGHPAAVQLLLERGANPNAADKSDVTPLCHAASGGYAAVVALLLKSGANPEPKGESPLQAATTSGHDEVVKLLLSAGVKVARDKKANLTEAAMMGGIKVVRALLQAGADPNQADEEGFTPLMGAVRAGNAEVIEALLQAGANVNAVNQENDTALDLAYDNIQAGKGQAKFLELLGKGELDGETKQAIATLKRAQTDEFVELLKKHGGKRAKELGKKAPKPAPEPKEPEEAEVQEAELPNFAKRAAKGTYREAVAEMERIFGSKAIALQAEAEEGSHLKGCVSFRVASEAGQKILNEHQERLLQRGLSLVRHSQGFSTGKDQIALLPTSDWREVLMAMQTNGGNYDLMPEDVVKWLEKLEKEQPFRLTGASHDWCEGVFTEPLKNTRQLAKKMYGFCPDIVDQGVGTVAALARELSKSQKFYFWWD
jgi:ankyrin repeat protein